MNSKSNILEFWTGNNIIYVLYSYVRRFFKRYVDSPVQISPPPSALIVWYVALILLPGD